MRVAGSPVGGSAGPGKMENKGGWRWANSRAITILETWGDFIPWPSYWLTGCANPSDAAHALPIPTLAAWATGRTICKLHFMTPLNLRRKTWLSLCDSTPVLKRTPPGLRFLETRLERERKGGGRGLCHSHLASSCPSLPLESEPECRRQARSPADRAALGTTCLPATPG